VNNCTFIVVGFMAHVLIKEELAKDVEEMSLADKIRVTELDGKRLINALAQQQKTLFVGDLSILVHVKTLHDLFSPFGEILKVELKQSCDGSKSFANFAFVEYVSRNDANQAKSSTDGTLYFGRKLRYSISEKMCLQFFLKLYLHHLWLQS